MCTRLLSRGYVWRAFWKASRRPVLECFGNSRSSPNRGLYLETTPLLRKTTRKSLPTLETFQGSSEAVARCSRSAASADSPSADPSQPSTPSCTAEPPLRSGTYFGRVPLCWVALERRRACVAPRVCLLERRNRDVHFFRLCERSGGTTRVTAATSCPQSRVFEQGEKDDFFFFFFSIEKKRKKSATAWSRFRTT